MILRPHRILALLLAATLAAPAQQPVRLDDPANLAGERVSPQDPADTLPIDHGAPALEQLLRKLRTRASFMLIVAHPDDEDGGMLTYLSRGQGARVAMLTLNRGEGGQNLMSADFDDALGLIRTQELLAADRYMAVDQFFGTEVDFGFSKTKEEAFAKWTHERVLYDAVRAVRLYRPLVIASVFIGAPSDGHGQHQVSGEIAQEVFNAAGDPKVFPDQIAAGLQPWQPLKVYARVPFARIDEHGMYDYATSQYTAPRFTNYVTGKVTATVPKANAVVPEGAADPLLDGLSYFQFAREGLALQKTQIGANVRLASPGAHDVSYHRYGSHLNQPDGDDSALEPSFFDGIDTSLAGMATLVPELAYKFRPALEKIERQIAEAQRLFDPAQPERTASPLRIALGSLDEFIRELESPNVNDLPADESYNLLHELRIKRVQCNNALVLALGLVLKADVKQPGASDAVSDLLTTQVAATFDLNLSAPSQSDLKLKAAEVSVPTKTVAVFSNKEGTPLQPTTALPHEVEFPGGLPTTHPYFFRSNTEQPVYDIAVPTLRNAPATPAPFTAHVTLDDGGVRLEMAAAVAGQTANSVQQPTVVVPPVSVSFSRSAGVIPLDDKKPMVWAESRVPISKCLSHNNDTPACNKFAEQSAIRLKLPSGWRVPESPDDVLSPDAAALTQYDGFTLAPPALHPGDRLNATAVATWRGKDYTEGFRPVGYSGLPTTNYFTPATYRATAMDLNLPSALVVGYVKGTGDEVSSSLFPLLGGHVIDVSVDHLTLENLKRFDAVILGVRAFEAHPNLAAASPALLAYAQAGGTVIVQYVARDIPPGSSPYPLNLGNNEKVVDETAPVRILAPDNPLLTWPNRILPADFDGWFEERGHGFMATWDPHYTPLLETHDPGQQPQQGGLLVARTGKGAWIYLGLALYRQLPEGVPGPYRLFVNLISAARNPAFASPSAPAK